MNRIILRRREFIKLSLLAGLSGLSACGVGSEKPILSASKETLPKDVIKALPPPWRFKHLGLESLGFPESFYLEEERTDLLAIGDGWLGRLQLDEFLPINIEGILPRLNSQAKNISKTFGDDSQTKVFPVGVSPWVMLFRNEESLPQKAQHSWEVLLEPALKGHLILPNSPRVVMSLADKIGSSDALEKLIAQAKTFDDRNSLNWLLSGQAKAAILPLQRCVESLFQDQRLSVALPSVGAPLNWTVLLRPRSSKKDLPISWLEDIWSFPLLGRLLARGWIAPVDYEALEQGRDFIRKDLQSIVLPEEYVWDRCWSLLPLNHIEMKELESRWLSAIHNP
tara:strand:+ start:1881 stop:2894 length:1014 start_codon:yes stop_codon:yes gene_type:complete